jgi:hypothetical protein
LTAHVRVVIVSVSIMCLLLVSVAQPLSSYARVPNVPQGSVQLVDHGWNILCAHIDDASDEANVAVTIQNGNCNKDPGALLVGSLWWQIGSNNQDVSKYVSLDPSALGDGLLIGPGDQQHLKLRFTRNLPVNQQENVTLTYSYVGWQAAVLNTATLLSYLSGGDLRSVFHLTSDDLAIIDAFQSIQGIKGAVADYQSMMTDIGQGHKVRAVKACILLVKDLIGALTVGSNKPARRSLYKLIQNIGGTNSAILSGNALHWLKNLTKYIDAARLAVEALSVDITSITTGGSLPSLGFVHYGTYQPTPTFTPTPTPTVTAPPAPVISAPAGVTNVQAVAVDANHIRLTWSDNSNNEDGFYVCPPALALFAFRSLSTSNAAVTGQSAPTPCLGNAPAIATLAPNSTQYVVSGLNPSTRYCYTVAVFNQGGGRESDLACATTLGAAAPPTILPPAPPGNVTTFIYTESPPSHIQVNWTDNSTNEDGFEISDGVSVDVKVGANSVSALMGPFPPGKYECFHVRAYNKAGSSAWSSGWSCKTIPSSSGNGSSGPSGKQCITGNTSYYSGVTVCITVDHVSLPNGSALTVTADSNFSGDLTLIDHTGYNTLGLNDDDVGFCADATTCTGQVTLSGGQETIPSTNPGKSLTTTFSTTTNVHQFFVELNDRSGTRLDTPLITVTWQ